MRNRFRSRKAQRDDVDTDEEAAGKSRRTKVLQGTAVFLVMVTALYVGITRVRSRGERSD